MKFYVYLHVDPDSGKVVYVGKGTAGRAWSCGSSTAVPGKRGNRTKEHNAWISQLLARGYTPADFVRIKWQALDEPTARRIEAELLEKHSSEALFNRRYGLANLKITPEKVRAGREAREQGATWEEAANLVGVSKMTLWRALTNRTKALK